ncbi:phosphoribosyltransferase family protein [Cellulomonas sp.]|uniref:ComF family protein n=1 Tax=Cellulomonas sp. TaxID=40001 RepID=UPI002590D87A|nr:phosphoribosyltransferase family protein [Cellulomonas sp.]MCR6690493.1 phosphoribosyltransferase family protein [Cellulomonas sp.]
MSTHPPTTGRRRPARMLRAAGLELLTLVLPVECAGCGRPDVAWCVPCRAWLEGEPWRCEERAGRLVSLVQDAPVMPVLTLADNVGAVRASVVAWKERGRRDLTPGLAAGAQVLGRHVADALPPGPGEVLVVPAPSTSAARRRRGFAHVEALAAGVVTGLARAGVPARVAPVLRRAAGEQVGLGVRDRGRLVGRVHVARGTGPLVGRTAVLVDDLLTTGATLAAAARALVDAGAVPAAAVTLATTPGPGDRTRAGAGSPGSGLAAPDAPITSWTVETRPPRG